MAVINISREKKPTSDTFERNLATLSNEGPQFFSTLFLMSINSVFILVNLLDPVPTRKITSTTTTTNTIGAAASMATTNTTTIVYSIILPPRLSLTL